MLDFCVCIQYENWNSNSNLDLELKLEKREKQRTVPGPHPLHLGPILASHSAHLTTNLRQPTPALTRWRPGLHSSAHTRVCALPNVVVTATRARRAWSLTVGPAIGCFFSSWSPRRQNRVLVKIRFGGRVISDGFAGDCYNSQPTTMATGV